jgi:L-arabinose isomerase
MSWQTSTPGQPHIGVVGVGHGRYWQQFENLKDEMLCKLDAFLGKLRRNGTSPTCFGLVDNVESAYALVPALLAADLDVLFIDLLTYATSATFAVFARQVRVPTVLVALQPSRALDYSVATTRTQLLHDDVCSLPEFTGVARRFGNPVADVIIGTLVDDDRADEDVGRWCRVAAAVHDLRSARIGLMGHVLEGMLDMHADPTAINAAFGCHVVTVEPDELMRHYRGAREPALTAMRKKILDFFDTPEPGQDPITQKLSAKDLHIAAAAAVALEELMADKRIQGLAYYYEGEESSDMRTLVSNLIVGNSMLISRGVPVCGEFDLKTCIAMLIMDRLGMGGSFAELHPVDFARNSVLVGHDGPHHIGIAQGKPVLRSLDRYHGKPGMGASVEFSIRQGPITILSITVDHDGSFRFVVAEGEAIEGPTPPTGNTNTHARFGPDIRTFLREWALAGPTHHFALGVGHHALEIISLAGALGVRATSVHPTDDSRAGSASS